MEAINWILFALRSVFTVFPIEVATTLGFIFFSLSWVHRRTIVSLPAGQRLKTLGRTSIAGALGVLAVATLASWLPTLTPTMNVGGWWQRPSPLLAVLVVFVVVTFQLRREPLPVPGERSIAPRRRWWAYAPVAPLWSAIAVAFLLLVTVSWQISIGVSLPPGADRYGIGPTAQGLPAYMELHQGFGYVWGAGWPNHLATLITLVACIAAYILVLSVDANRPMFARSTAAEVRLSQIATARVLTLIALAGSLLTLGVVWAFVGFNGDRSIGIGTPEEGGAAEFYLGTGYQDFAGVMHLGGYIVQGLGAALLMRLAVDVWRELHAKRILLTEKQLPTTTKVERGLQDE